MARRTKDEAHHPYEPELPMKLEGIVIGTLVGLGTQGEPLVDFAGNPAGDGVVARSTVPLGSEAVGRSVALLFEAGDPARPIALGVVIDPTTNLRDRTARRVGGTGTSLDIRADGERLEIQAEREIVLQVGKASITLTRAGKILIRGTYVSSHSSGVHRLKGASVEIN